jgi:hypothetical protein
MEAFVSGALKMFLMSISVLWTLIWCIFVLILFAEVMSEPQLFIPALIGNTSPDGGAASLLIWTVILINPVLIFYFWQRNRAKD